MIIIVVMITIITIMIDYDDDDDNHQVRPSCEAASRVEHIIMIIIVNMITIITIMIDMMTMIMTKSHPLFRQQVEWIILS